MYADIDLEPSANCFPPLSSTQIMVISPADSWDCVDRSKLSPTPTSATCIRNRFLHRLGIEMVSTDSTFCPRTTSPYRRPRSVSFEEPLKPENSTSNTSPPPKLQERKATVSFDPVVSVTTIPSHADYSIRIKEALWTNTHEMQAQKLRNSVEFASEQYDWRLVVEEGDMLLYQGEKVHPCHFQSWQQERCFSAKDHFLECMILQRAQSHG
jgi:hypothetical protein